MDTNKKIKVPPPLPPKPKMKGVIPQTFSSTTTTSDAQYWPTPKPCLYNPVLPKHTLNQAGDADQYADIDSAAMGRRGSHHSCMGTNEKVKMPPPLSPKPKMKEVIPQISSITTTSVEQYQATHKPRLCKPVLPKHTLNQAGDADQYADTESAATDGSSEWSPSPTACPPWSPYLSHSSSKNRPMTIQDEDNYIFTSEKKVDEPIKDHSNVFSTARPLPKEPSQTAVLNGWRGSHRSSMDTNKKIKVPPPLPPKPKQTFSSTTTTSDVQYWPTPQPCLYNPVLPKHTLNQAGDADQYADTDSAAMARGNTGGNTEDIYTEADMTRHDDTALKRSTARQSSVSRKPQASQMSVPTQTNCCKEESKLQQKNQTKQKKPTASMKCPKPVPQSLPFQRTKSCPYGKTKKKQCDSWQVLQKTLWREHYMVKKSGILSKLTEKEIDLQENIYEVATSELSYFESLTLGVNQFMNSSELKCTITPQVQKELFSNIDKVKETSKNFLNSMAEELCLTCTCEVLCEVVHDYAKGHFQVYVDYIRNIPRQTQTLTNLKKDNSFKKISQKLEKHQNGKRLPLDFFLLMPFQRITSLKLLMEAIMKRAALHSKVRASAEAALARISEVLEVCDKEMGVMQQIEKVLMIANKIDFRYTVTSLPLVSSSRRLIKVGEVTKLALNAHAFGKNKNAHFSLILFNDLLLVASKKGTDRYSVHDHGFRIDIKVIEGAKVKDDLEEYDASKVFQLVILKNHKNCSEEFLLQTSTVDERDSWLDELRNGEEVHEQCGSCGGWGLSQLI